MNIEEEWKLFDKVLGKAIREENVKLHEAMEATRTGGLRILQRGFFEVWCLAKAHAEEMAKRWVMIKRKGADANPSSYPWLVVCLESGPLEDFRSEEAARVWAEQAGYRVVGE